MDELGDYTSQDITLKLTCEACPEQYEAYDEHGNHVGYLRLRHGRFTVECPDVGYDLVLVGHPEGDGMFTWEERTQWLEKAVTAIKEWMTAHGKA